MTIWQENAHTFATTPGQAVAAGRNQAREKVLELIVDGDRAQAYRELCASVNKQARISGAGKAQIS